MLLSSTVAPAYAEAPSDLLALLPASATVQQAVADDFAGSGQNIWAVHYTVPHDEYSNEAHLLLARPGTDGWSMLGDSFIAQTYGSSMQVVSVGGLPSIALSAGVGAHSTELFIVRWQGTGFTTVFDRTSSAAIETKDLDGDGSVEIVDRPSFYCGYYAISPVDLEIDRWDGSNFVDATAAFPSMLADTDAQVRTAWYEAHYANTNQEWDAAGTKCLDQARDSLSTRSGLWSTVASVSPTADSSSTAYVPAPQFPTDNRLFKIVGGQTLRVSTTQGRTWEDLSSIPGPCRIDPTLQLSPTFATDQTMLALNADTSCLLRVKSPGWISRDGGHTWSALGNLAASSNLSIRREPTILFSPTYATDQQLWLTTDGTLAGSANGGRDWRTLTLPSSRAQIVQFAPPGLLAINDPTREPSKRYFRTTDNGSTWQEITDAFRDPSSLAVTDVKFLTGADPSRVYATANAGTWYSADRGATWKKIGDKPVEAVTSDGCAVAGYQQELGLICDGKTNISLKAPGAQVIRRVLSVGSFADHGSVLVETDKGLAVYRFRP
jgi:hypothetical protein